jgi:hypothetical protein
MSTRQAVIRNWFNLDLGNVANAQGAGLGVSLGVSFGGRVRRVGSTNIVYLADTGVTVSSLRAVPVVTHKWAAKVGKYNDDPIWAEVFQNIRENRRRLKEGLNDLE